MKTKCVIVKDYILHYITSNKTVKKGDDTDTIDHIL